MSGEEKIVMLKSLLGISDNEQDAYLNNCLRLAKMEINAWRYNDEAAPEDVEPRYVSTQIHAVVAGFSLSGAENQVSHSENGISRAFKYSDMLEYIQAHVVPMVKTL